jgi:two-component system, LytTR family, sensor kinase
MKKTILYSLHGFVWFCDLSIIFLVTLAGNLWATKSAMVSTAMVLGILAWSLGIFYSGYSFIVPKFFSKNKFGTGILTTIGVCLIFPLLPQMEKVISAISGKGWMGYSLSGYVQVFFLSLFICGAGILLRAFVNWINNQQKKKELENEKLKSKLMVLVNQNNPHFIFNVLNNIDSLITSKPAKASETINKLSGLLRYVYSNSEKDRVNLTSEIEYIENYIELQSLRLDSNVKVEFDKNLQENIQVVPMLFLPFIENAFKHGLVDNEHPLKLKFLTRDRELIFECINNTGSENNNKSDSGFGLSNIIKRLDLMYPSKYNLNIDNKENAYSVSLSLQTNEN